MKKKRIVSVLLAIMMLFTMDVGNLYAMEAPEDSRQYTQESQEEPRQILREEQEEEEVSRYTVTFDLNGGSTASGESAFSMQVEEGETVNADEVADVIKRGYLFQGWQDEDGNYYAFDQPVTKDFTLLASWTPITYRVQFDVNGGKGEAPPEREVAYEEEFLIPISGCYKTDYVLVGWELEGVGICQENTKVKNLTDQDGAVVVLKAAWQNGEYKVIFDANGGSGTMPDQAFNCGQSKKLNKNDFEKKGYTFIGWNTRPDGSGQSYGERESVSFPNQTHGSTVTLFAIWKGNSYSVNYNGNGAKSGVVSPTSHVYGTESALGVNRFQRSGYTFVGWNTKKDGKGKTYKAGEGVKTLTSKAGGSVTLYAKWTAIKYTITYNTKKGKLPGNAKKSYNITTSTYSLPAPTRSGYDFDGWYTDAKCKKRVSQLKKGSIGNKKYYAKWVKCTRKPNKSRAKITTCKATKTSRVSVKATVKNRVASSNDCYYLVYVNPISGKPYKMAAKSYKKKKLSFSLKTTDNQGYVTALFGIAVKKNGKYTLISSSSYVKNPEKAAKNKSKYKLGKTKKGIQFSTSMQEIDSCTAKNTFLNLTVSQLCTNATIPYKYNGKTYYFNQLVSQQQIVSECNKKGINVTMQVLLDWVGGQEDLIDSKARVAGAAPFYTWNVRSSAGREKMEAMFCYLGSVFGTKKCYVSNWVLGNEINNPGSWNYKGILSTNAYFRSYAQAFRSLYYAVKSQYSNARVFICVDNLWNTHVAGGYSAKYSISQFYSQLQKIQKGLKWNLAYHAYSAPLTYTNFWDGFGLTYDENSPYITMKNLKVLTDYIRRKYGSSVRTILSEQGYASNWGQANQAAAIAASYYIAACNPYVDAFIIRSYHDHPVEVAQGLPMGIHGKEAFNVFKYMDTTKTFSYTNRYRGLIGISSWKQLVPYYSKTRLYKMYRK